MSISRSCWKYLTLTYNVFFAVSALVLFGFSGYFLYKLFIYRLFIGITVQYPAILLLMIGIITCSVAWIGWRTTSSMHQLHVTVAGILILAVVVAEFAIFVWAMVIWDNVDVEIKTSMTTYFMQTTQAQGNLTTAADAIRWDKLHVKMQCCGLSGPGDYSASGHVPFSCCGQGPLDALQKPYTADCTTLYQRGCAKPLHEYAREQILYVAMAALVASVVQSVGVFCTFSLAYSIGNRFNTSTSSSVRHRVSAPDDALLEASRIVTRDHEKATAPVLSRY